MIFFILIQIIPISNKTIIHRIIIVLDNLKHTNLAFINNLYQLYDLLKLSMLFLAKFVCFNFYCLVTLYPSKLGFVTSLFVTVPKSYL